jgi:hypothetical protein
VLLDLQMLCARDRVGDDVLETRRARGVVLGVLAVVVVASMVGLNRYSAPRADAQAARVVAAVSEELEGYDTAVQFHLEARSGSVPDLPAPTTIMTEGEGLVTRTTVREAATSRCVTVTAQPVQPDGPLRVEDVTISSGSC